MSVEPMMESQARSTAAPSPWAVYLAAICVPLLFIYPLSLVHPELGAPRNWQIPLNALLFLGLVFWPARMSAPSLPGWSKKLFAVSVAVFCLSVELGKYFAFEMNGVDFSIFDWALYNSNHRAFGYFPIYGVNVFGIHAHYILLPLIPLHRLFESPLFLVVTGALVMGAAAVPLWKLARHEGLDEGFSALLVLAYLTNPFTGALLDGGFRPEMFYPLFGLLFLLGWRQGRPRLWIPAAFAFLMIKEDAALYLGAFAAGALLLERGRRRAAAGLIAGALVLLVFSIFVLQPRLLGPQDVQQAHHLSAWAEYGGSPREIALGMLHSPWRLGRNLATSGWLRFFWPMLFLPLLSAQVVVAMLPALLIFGSSSYRAMHELLIYYPAPLLPFALAGLAFSPRRLRELRIDLPRRELIAAAAVLLFPLVGNGYSRLHPPKLAKLETLHDSAAQLQSAGPLCVQTAIFPHLPYTWELHPYFEKCRADPKATVLLDPSLNSGPFTREDLEADVEKARSEHRLHPLGAGIFLIQ